MLSLLLFLSLSLSVCLSPVDSLCGDDCGCGCGCGCGCVVQIDIHILMLVAITGAIASGEYLDASLVITLFIAAGM